MDGEGNPYVFLSKVVREVEVETEDEDDEIINGEKGKKDVKENGSGRGREEGTLEGEAAGDGDVQSNMKPKPTKDLPISFWAENDLNISEVQGIKMWDKEIWAGRL